MEILASEIESDDLCSADAAVTAELFDTGSLKSHKIIGFKYKKSENLETFIRNLYEKCGEHFEIKPLHSAFGNDAANGFNSFGVFSRKKFEKNEILPGLVGILALAGASYAEKPENQFSVYKTPAGNHIMLGPLSFINSSCKPNAQYQSQFVKKLVLAKATLPIAIGDEITVTYSGSYFGTNREYCQCPYKEYHGNVVFKGKTRKQTAKIRRVDPSAAYILTESITCTPAVRKESNRNESPLMQNNSQPSCSTPYSALAKSIEPLFNSSGIKIKRRASRSWRHTKFQFSCSIDTEDNLSLSSKTESNVNVTSDLSIANVLNDVFIGDASELELPVDFNDSNKIALDNSDDHYNPDYDSDLDFNSNNEMNLVLASSPKLMRENFPWQESPSIPIYSPSFLANSNVSRDNLELCYHLFAAHYGLPEAAKIDLRKILNSSHNNSVIPPDSLLAVNEELVTSYYKEWITTSGSFFSVDIDFQLKIIMAKNLTHLLKYNSRKFNENIIDDIILQIGRAHV